jgi:hypothetical protein
VVRVRDHIAISTAAAAVLRPWFGRRVLGLWAGGVLIDADHYLWFCRRERRLSPVAAVRFFNQADAPQLPATRVLHRPVALVPLLLLGLPRRALRPLALGLGMHVALDAVHGTRMRRARFAALERDGSSCQACGARTRVGTHLRRQPLLLPSYDASNLITLCDRCHERAHTSRRGARRWR